MLNKKRKKERKKDSVWVFRVVRIATVADTILDDSPGSLGMVC